MDDDRWRSCGSDWDDPGTGPLQVPVDVPPPVLMPDARRGDADVRPRTAAPRATGPGSAPADLGDCA
ncbi:hypothetical protein [Solwaraspora sp. WMMA2065]|uniref:hypothetical protein n=1 Tax=Solwaraspora sp. WMMA2065 TaxID=3015166 RepID=UPI00259BE736|nr:hypothetical protein [Solwaraspora sp. WMMA2065]WJK32241.1 hypothetical protein O7610_15760 [Solwaraspora sp. WMMA2065]